MADPFKRKPNNTAVIQQRAPREVEADDPQICPRHEALAMGQGWYFTGVPCPHGHVARRSVSNRECRACADARTRTKREKDPTPFRAREGARRAKDAELFRARSRASYAANIEKRRAYDRRRNAEPDRLASIIRRAGEYAKRHPGRINALTAKRRASLAQATPAWLSAEHFAEMRGLYERARQMLGKWEVDHIVPLRGEGVCGLHVPWNLRIVPLSVNRKKGNRHSEDLGADV